MTQETRSSTSYRQPHSRTSAGRVLFSSILLLCCGLPFQSAQAQLGSVITDCANATTIEDFVTLFGRGLCLNGFSSSRGWVFTDPLDSTFPQPDPPDPFPLPVIRYSGDLEFRAEADTITADEPNKFYIVSREMSDLPPFLRPTLPHPQVIGPFFYGTVASPVLVTLDQTDITQILGMQQNNSTDNRVVILQHGAGFDFNNPGVERFTGVRFEEAQNDNLLIYQICPDTLRGDRAYNLGLRGRANTSYTFSAKVHDSDGNDVETVTLTVNTNSNGVAVTPPLSVPLSHTQFGFSTHDDAGIQTDANTITTDGQPLNPGLAAIKSNPFEPPIMWTIPDQAAKFAEGEKVPNSDSGYYFGPNDGSCDQLNRLYAINEFDGIDQNGTSNEQFIEIYTDQPNLNGLVLISAVSSTPLIPDDEPDRSLSSLDLDGLTPNADGYVVIGPVNMFFVVSEDEIHGLGLYEIDEPVPFNTPLNTLRSAEYEFIEYKRLSAGNMGHLIKGGNENGNGHPKRDSLQFCPDASEMTFPEDPLPAPPTLGAKNICALPDDTGQSTVANTPDASEAGDPISAATGEFYTLPETDIDLGGPLPLRFVRRYAAFLSDDGRVNSPLGPNWVHDFELQLSQPDSDTIEITYFGGQLLTFREDSGTGDWVLASPLQIPHQLRFAGDEFRLMDPSRERVYTFNGFNSGSLSFGRLESIEDRNGNLLEVDYQILIGGSRTIDNISDGLGRMLQFSYTGNQLTQISDGVRNLNFGYSNGVLISATDALGSVTQYSYDTNTTHGPLLTTIILPEGNTPFSQTYDSNGTVTQQQDAFGNTLDLMLDTPAAGLTSVTDDAGSTVFTHDAFSLAAIDIQDRNGAAAQLSYDDASRVDTLFDRNSGAAQGRTTRRYHPESGKLASLTDAEGNTTQFSYQLQIQNFGSAATEVSFNFYNLVQIMYADGSTADLTHDARGNVLSYSNPLGQVTLFGHNLLGQIETVTGPTGGVVTQGYDASGNLTSFSDSASGITHLEYDALNRVIAIRPPQTSEPSAPEILLSRDANDRITAITDANGNTTLSSFDGNGNRISIEDPDGLTSEIGYNLMDQVNTITDRLNNSRQRNYDALLRLSGIVDADGISTVYGYNAESDLTTVSVGLSTVSIAYDNEGSPTSVTSPLSFTTALDSDRMGRITAITNPLGERRQIQRDARGNLAELTLADNRSWQFERDTDTRLIGVDAFDSNSNLLSSATYDYGDSGLLTNITDPNGAAWSFVNTPEGRLESQTDPLLQTVTYNRDDRGRIAEIALSDAGTRSFSHDANGNITRIAHSGGLTLDFSYDNQNRLIGSNDLILNHDAEGGIIDSRSNGVGFGADYTPARRLDSVSYNDGQFSVNYQYDPITGLLQQVSDTLTGTVLIFVHDLDRRLIRIERSNGTETAYEYDTANRLTRITASHTASSHVFLDLHYNLNSVGDVINQTAITPISLDSILFNQQTQDFSVDAASQINSVGFAYDPRGRRTASPQNALIWDEANRLTSLNGLLLGHNGLGDVITRSGTAFHRLHYNAALGGRPMVAEQNAGGGFDHFYVYTPAGRLLYLIDVTDGNAVHHYDFDRVGSTQVLTDSAGNVSNAYAYLPFGQILTQSGNSSQPFTYNGQFGVQQLDDAGRYFHMRARVYDSHTASFLTREPLWPIINNPSLLNPYQFALQNPLRLIDPTGLMTEEKFNQQYAGAVLADLLVGVDEDVRLALELLQPRQARCAGTDHPAQSGYIVPDGDTPAVEGQFGYGAGLFLASLFAPEAVEEHFCGPKDDRIPSSSSIRNSLDANTANQVNGQTQLQDFNLFSLSSQPVLGQLPDAPATSQTKSAEKTRDKAQNNKCPRDNPGGFRLDLGNSLFDLNVPPLILVTPDPSEQESKLERAIREAEERILGDFKDGDCVL